MRWVSFIWDLHFPLPRGQLAHDNGKDITTDTKHEMMAALSMECHIEKMLITLDASVTN